MKTSIKTLFLALASIFLLSCQNGKPSEESNEAAPDTVVQSQPSENEDTIIKEKPKKTAEEPVAEQKTERKTKSHNPLVGHWRLTHYLDENGMTEVDTAKLFRLTVWNEKGFTMYTDCNDLYCQYSASGNNIKFIESFRHEMACPEMEIERAMVRILPKIQSFEITPDSVLILKTKGQEVARFSHLCNLN